MRAHNCKNISGILLSCAIGSIVVSAAHADVIIEERMSVQGAGLMKMANMSGRTVTKISKDRARTDSDLKFESALLRTFGGSGQSTEIVRLDQDKIYTLDPKARTYTETTFAEQRAQMQQVLEQMEKAQQSQRQAVSGVDESQCEWSEPKTEVNRSGETATIAGYRAERLTITATQSCRDKSTGQVCDFGLTLDSWIAPDFEASSEATAYQRAYAEKIGFNAAASKDFAQRAESMFGTYEDMWKEVAAKTKDLEGYPVKSSFGLAVGGPQCQSAQQTQAAGGPAEPPSIGQALGGALGGLLGRKKAPEPAAAASTPPPAPNGLMPLMTVTTELVSVNKGTIAANEFEVPADFKKKAQ
jgi:hypothetical protein